MAWESKVAEGSVSNVLYDDGLEEIEGLETYVREVASQVQQWAHAARDSSVPSMIDRMTWRDAKGPLGEIRRAHHELGANDLVGSTAELVEGLMFQGIKWESSDAAVADYWNQMAGEQNLDEQIRKLGREQFACSQVIVGLWWDWGTFKARGKTKNGNARKQTKKIYYPRRVTVLDPARVVPVGLLAFGQEQLAWVATKEEIAAFELMQRGEGGEDEIMGRFFVTRYEPSGDERKRIKSWGVDPTKLILLNRDLVRRHTLTRSDYEPFAPVRMKGAFHLIDLRQQLMEADRVSLIGAANYILLVKKGDKDRPARQEEINNLRAGFRTLAKVPVIFSDHRLEIEIITPKVDFTLSAEKYDLLDRRIVQRLLSSISSNDSRRGQTGASVGLGKPLADTLNGRRRMLRRFLEQLLAREVVNHPANEGLADTPPSLAYSPANIKVDDDTALAQQILSLRTQKELSRETTLDYFGFDQAAEAMRRELEEDQYDDIFQTQVPFSAAPGNGQSDGEERPPADQGGRGAEGGRPEGGGQPSQNPTKTNMTKTGNTSSKGAK